MPVKEYHPGHLEKAIRSLLEQSSPAWRLIVIAEPEDVESLAAVLAGTLEDERAALVANEGLRLAGAINTGMRHATTDFVAILLGDDMWAQDAVEVMTGQIQRFPEVDFFHSGRVIIDAADQPISSELPARERFTLDDFPEGSPVRHLLCWRRERGLAIGGLDETIRNVGPDDYDFPWSMAESGARFKAVPGILYLYRDHRDAFRLTTHLPTTTHVRELRRIFRKHGLGRVRAYRLTARARRGYLRECIFRNPVDRWLKERFGFDPSRGWRQTYR